MKENIKNIQCKKKESPLIKFKGQTKIELFEKGEKVGEVKDNNMMTNMLSKVFNPPRVVAGGVSSRELLQGLTPIYNVALGGLLLYENTIDEDVEAEFSSVSNKCIGHAGGDYSGVQATRGTLNASETGYINDSEKWRGYRYVWDFSTDKANGTISCACLTSKCGGNSGYGNGIDYAITESNNYFHVSPANLNNVYATSGQGFDIANTNEILSEAFGMYLGQAEDGYSRFSYFQNKSQLVLVELPIENSEVNIIDDFTGYGKQLDFNNIGKSGMTYRINRYDMPFEIDASNTSVFIEDGKLFIVSMISNTNFKFCTFDADSKNFSTVENRIVSPAFTDFTNQLCKAGNYWFAFSSDRTQLIKYPYAGGTGEAVDTIDSVGRLQPFNGDLVKIDIGQTSRLSVYDVENPELNFKSIDTYSGSGSMWYPYIYEQGIIMEVDLYTKADSVRVTPTAYRLSPYLATINNLQTPITKTSAQTMKITYEVTPTIEEVVAE